MEKEKKQIERSSSHLPTEKSFAAAIEQMASLLRTQVKLSERNTKILSRSSLPSSFNNSFEQIAKLLRKEIRAAKTPKKRSWKAYNNKIK